ncbi:TPA: hypothetical protein QCP80_003279 [Bacillus cereus]|nr:hypothetical protein [Bacillus cereus]
MTECDDMKRKLIEALEGLDTDNPFHQMTIGSLAETFKLYGLIDRKDD